MKKNRKLSPLEAKLAKNRAKGQRTPAATEAKIVHEYTTEPDTSYRDLATRHGVSLGTVRRIIQRVGTAAVGVLFVLALSIDTWV